MFLTIQKHAHTLSGLLFVTLFALASLYFAKTSWLINTGISPLIIAIILGIFYGNTLRNHLPIEWNSGIHFAAKRLLRISIILYGFRVSFQQIASVGLQGLIIDLLVVSSTLFLGGWIGVKLFKLDRHLAILIASGSAVCGAAAVLAVEDVLKSDTYKAAIAVGTVILFGTLAMFLYPLLQYLGILGFSNHQFGIFTGASIHEVAQALVAGNNINIQTGNIAVIVKMARVLLLVPVLLLLSFIENNYSKPLKRQKLQLTIPWFAIGFATTIGFNSLHLLPLELVNLINGFDIFLLTMAMTAIGMETNLAKIKTVGLKPFYLATVLFAWLIVSAALLVKFFVS